MESSLSHTRSFISRRALSVAVGLICLGLCIGLNLPGLGGPMVFDSLAFMVANEHLFAYGSVHDVLAIYPIRPVVMLSFYLNYLVGGMDSLGFRVVNAIFYSAAGLVVFLLVLAAFDTPALRTDASDRSKTAVAVFAAVGFVTHPLQYQVVLYVWQRMALFACFFCYCRCCSTCTQGSGL